VIARFIVQWTQTAVEDLLSIIDDVVDRDGAVAAERLYGQITQVVAGLETLPLPCRIVHELQAEGLDGYRDVLVGPHRLMLTVRGRAVVILTAMDGRRDLGDLLIERALRERG
jgi:toxin ParE1/3/4